MNGAAGEWFIPTTVDQRPAICNLPITLHTNLPNDMSATVTSIDTVEFSDVTVH